MATTTLVSANTHTHNLENPGRLHWGITHTLAWLAGACLGLEWVMAFGLEPLPEFEDKIVSEFETAAGAVPFLTDFLPLAYSGGLPFAVRGALNLDALSAYMEAAVGISIIIIGANGMREAREWGIAHEGPTEEQDKQRKTKMPASPSVHESDSTASCVAIMSVQIQTVSILA